MISLPQLVRSVLAQPARREKAARALVGVYLLGLVVWQLGLRWRFLQTSPLPMGVDGYFYVSQTQHVLQTGAPSGGAQWGAPLLLAPFAAGWGAIDGVKVGAAWWTAVGAVPMYGLVAAVTKQRWAGLVAATVFATSATGFYFAVEFVKNGMAITLALAVAWSLAVVLMPAPAVPPQSAAQARAPRALAQPVAPLVAALLVASLAWLTHRTALPMVVVIIGPVIAAVAWQDRRVELPRQGARRLLPILLVALSVATAASVTLGSRSAALRSQLGAMFDLQQPRWSLPVLALPQHSLWFRHEALAMVIVTSVALVTTAVGWWRLRAGAGAATRQLGLAIGAWLLALVIGLPIVDVADPQGVGFRLRLLAFVPLSVASGVVIAVAIALVKRNAGGLADETARETARETATPSSVRRSASARLGASLSRALVPVLVIGLLLALLARAPRSASEGVVRMHPAMAAALQSLPQYVVPDASTADRALELALPERHLALAAKWYGERAGARMRVRLRPSEATTHYVISLGYLQHASRQTREVFIRAVDLARTNPALAPVQGIHPLYADGLLLIPAATWRTMMTQLPPAARQWFAAWVIL